MNRPTRRLLIFLLLASFLTLGRVRPALSSSSSQTDSRPQPVNGYDLIAVVNSLRASNGLPAYQINSILMSIAQTHSEYQASTGTVTHYGPGGTRPYQRALNAGYNVENALSNPPGFFAENIQAGSGLSAQDIVNRWMGDAEHQNTMLSPNLVDAGAGVACSGDYCYFTLDAGRQSGTPYTPPPAGATLPAGGTPGSIGPVVIPNTPESDGSIKHTVREGETLFTIALAYGVTVDEIKRLNRLTSNIIYVGDVLIIRPPTPAGTATVTETGTPKPTFTPFVFWTVTPSITPTFTPVPIAPIGNESGAMAVGVIVVAALVLAGVLTASGRRKSNPQS
ncbi:MAG: CAP domain-containing protein [Chloroflexota bacterium]